MVAWLYPDRLDRVLSTLFLPFGDFLASTFQSDFGWPFTSVWIICALLCIAMIYWFVYNGARVSTNVSVLLGTIEISILAVLSARMIINAGNRSTMSVFDTSHANVPAFVGAAGIIGAMVFAIYGFVGVENVVPLAEEAHDPRRNVMRAAILSPFFLGLFVIFCRTRRLCSSGCVGSRPSRASTTETPRSRSARMCGTEAGTCCCSRC